MPRKPSPKVLNCVQITHKQDDEDGPSQVSVTSHSSTSSQETLDVDQADQVSIQEPLTSRPTRAAKVKFLQQVPQLVVTDTHLDTVEKIKTEPSSQEYDQLCEVTASDSIADQMPNVNGDIVYEFDSIDGITSKDIKTEDNVLEEEYEVRRVLKMEIDVESEGIQQTTFEENNLMVDSNKVQDIIEDAMQELLEEQQREDIVDATSIDTTTENAGKLLNRRKYRAKLKAKKPNEKQKHLDSGSVEYYITEDDEVKNVKTRPSSEESELLCYNSATTRISDSLLAPRPTRAAKVKCLQLISEAVSYDSSSDENPVASHHRHQQHEGAEVHLHGLKEIQQCSSEYGDNDNSEQRELSEEKLRQLAIKHVDALRVICHRINIRQFTSKYKIKESVAQDEQHLPKIIECVRTQTVSEHNEKHELQDVSTRVANEYVVQHEQDLEEHHELILRERKRYSKNADSHPHTVVTIKTEPSNQKYDQHLPKLLEFVSTQIMSDHVDHNHQNTSKYTANENVKAHAQRQEIERQHCEIKVKGELSFGLGQRRNEKALQRYLKCKANESPEERKQRRERKRQKRLQREANESVEQRKQRLQKKRQSNLQSKANESVEQREQRRQRERQRYLKWFANECVEQRKQREQRKRQKFLQRKANETVEQRERRLERQRKYYKKKMIDQLTVEKLEQRREKGRQYYSTKTKGQLSVEKIQQRKESSRQWRLKRKANESVEEREQRLQRRRQKYLQRKVNETVEQREQRLEKQRQYNYKQKRKANKVCKTLSNGLKKHDSSG